MCARLSELNLTVNGAVVRVKRARALASIDAEEKNEKLIFFSRWYGINQFAHTDHDDNFSVHVIYRPNDRSGRIEWLPIQKLMFSSFTGESREEQADWMISY